MGNNITPNESPTFFWVQALYTVLKEQLDDADDLFRQHGLNPDKINSIDYLPSDTHAFSDILDEASVMLQNDALSLHVAQSFVAYTKEHLLKDKLRVQDWEAILDCLLVFYPSEGTQSSLVLHFQNNEIEFEISPQSNHKPMSQFSLDGCMAVLRLYIQILTNHTNNDEKCFFVRRKPKNINVFEQIFGQDITFCHTSNTINIKNERLNPSIPKKGDLLPLHLDQLLNQSITQLNTYTFSKSVYDLMDQNCTKEASRIAFIADQLAMSERTLQRKLAREGLCFNDLTTSIKLKKAKALLLGEQLPHVDISLHLGFSSHSNFIRFFRTHTGVTPKNFVSENVK